MFLWGICKTFHLKKCSKAAQNLMNLCISQCRLCRKLRNLLYPKQIFRENSIQCILVVNPWFDGKFCKKTVYISPTVSCFQKFSLTYQFLLGIIVHVDRLTVSHKLKYIEYLFSYRSVMLLCGSILLSFGAPFSPLFLGSIKTHPSKGNKRTWLHFSDVCLQFGLKFNKLFKLGIWKII